jgi:uncharacterized protein (TIGR03435 family)
MRPFGVTTCTRLIAAITLPLLAVSVFAQAPARPEFEVASIKPAPNCGGGRGGGPSPGRLNLPCTNLRNLIRIAYAIFAAGGKITPTPIEFLGGPAWLDSENFEIDAKAANADAPLGQMAGPMLQALLEDRFKVKVHKESREVPVYTLTVMKSGAKFQPSKEGSCTPLDPNHIPAGPAPGEPQPNFCGGMSERSSAAGVTADGHGMTMAEFAGGVLARNVDRPVIDKTGLTGMFEFHLEYVREMGSSGPVRLNGVDTPNAPAAASDGGGPSIYTAVQEQLGLKLTPDKGPVEVLVVDHAEKPSEN